MFRTIIPVICFILCSVIRAQGNIIYGPLYADSFSGYYHIFGDKVNIRSSADKNSEVLKQIIIGDSIKVVKTTDVLMEMNGMIYPWVQVEWISNKQKKTGYIWGGLLSFYHEHFQSEEGVSYSVYLGPLKYDTEKQKLLGEARLTTNGNIKDQANFELNLFDAKHPVFEMGIYKSEYRQVPTSYRNIEHVLSVGFTQEKCGPSGMAYVLINKGTILFAGSELGSYDGGSFAEGNEFVFPWDKGGMKEKIFEYYSFYSSAYDEEPEVDTTYILKTYTKIDGKFKLTKTHSK